MKIGIVGDLHIAPPPKKRIDDYFQAGLNKITEISKNCSHIIFLGDIFTSPKVDEKYTYDLIEHLYNLRCLYNTKFYTIIGNHDVQGEEESNLRDSSLGLLAASRFIQIITPENPLILNDDKFYNFYTIPVKYKNAKQYLKDKQYPNAPNTENILLVHHEYETGTNCFTYDDFKDLNCNHIFLGHDHKPFDEGRIIYPEFTVYRSGSIMRNRADDYNLNRELYYFVLEKGQISVQTIDTIPAKNVFSVEAYERLDFQKKQFTESIDDIIEKYENNINTQDKFSIKNIMEQLNTPEPNIDYIKKHYEKLGEVFN